MLDTYWSGFSVCSWRRLTQAQYWGFQGKVVGVGDLRIAGVAADGQRVVLHTWQIAGEASLDFELGADLDWVWVELDAGPVPLTLEDGQWYASGPVRSATVGAAITTMDRPDSCLALIEELLVLPADLLRTVIVVDQGLTPLPEHPRFAEVARLAADRLRYVRQPNLGGSGGFSRGMDEVARIRQDPATHVMLLDDDIELRAETVRRALAYARFGYSGLLGTHMFSLAESAVMHATGEIVDRSTMFWETVPGGLTRPDLSTTPVTTTPQLREPCHADFAGWWACLIPMAVVEQVGYALPIFIKWDDAEFGLRAGASGYPTWMVPGIGVGHVAWSHKDTSVDWQVYYLVRNRMIVAALEGRGPRWVFLSRILATTAKHVLTMAYETADLAVVAIEDFLAGPGAIVARAPQGRVVVPPGLTADPEQIVDRVEVRSSRLRGILRALVWAPRASGTVVSTLEDANSWKLANADRAVIVSAGGTAYLRRRDRTRARRLAMRLLRVLARVAVRWPGLGAEYREARATMTSPTTWRQMWDQKPK